jgi:predicted PurR-regulated permease PerM
MRETIMSEPTSHSGDPAATRELEAARAETMRRATEVAIRIGVLAVVVGWCLTIVAPFIGIVVWGAIIAIGADTPYEAIVRWLGGRRGLAATLIVALSLAVIVVPTVMLSDTLISGAHRFAEDLKDDKLHVPPPPPDVAGWPVVGPQIFDLWQLASHNLRQAAEKLTPQLRAVSRWLLGAAGAVGAGLLQFVASLVLAGVFLARRGERAELLDRVAARLAGPERGVAFARLARATVRSVVQGIVGVAIIQALLAGVGFIAADIPGAGLWALLVLVAAIVQLPVALVMIAPIAIAFSTAGTAVAVAFTLWCLAISALDNVLKPMLFGRGVEVPTVVIFIGAIGGMISMGILGLFVGAVVLGLGYELVRAWIAEGDVGLDPV